MHFWIDKRSQCAYPGRYRVPSSLSSGVGRVGPGVGGRKGMAAPVHRFAPIDCPPRRPRTSRHRSRYETQPPAVHTSRRQAEESNIYMEILPEPPQPTIASLAAARSVTPDTLLRTAALGLHHQSPVMAPHLKFGMLVSFALASLFLAGAKYCFDKQMVRDAGPGGAGGGEAGVVCAAVACACGVGCALSLCRAPPPPPHVPDRVSSTARRDRARPPPAPPSEPSPSDASLSTLAGGQSPSPEAPPPYHIAVLLPPREGAASPPPPAYNDIS